MEKLNTHETDQAAQLANWSSKPPSSDWVPATDDQWIGDDVEHPRGIALGKPIGADPSGIQGVVVERGAPTDPGIAVVGYIDQPTRVVNPGAQANAPVELAGVPVLLAGPVVIDVQEPLTEERYLLLGPSTTAPDGRHFSPLLLGPAYVPSFSEQQTDVRDLRVTVVPDTIVILGPLANTYQAGLSTFRYEVRLSAEGSQGRTVEFDVEFWVDAVFVSRDEFSLAGSAQNISVSVPITTTVNAGSIVEMRVGAVETHPNAEGWVRGSVRASLLELRQG